MLPKQLFQALLLYLFVHTLDFYNVYTFSLRIFFFGSFEFKIEFSVKYNKNTKYDKKCNVKFEIYIWHSPMKRFNIYLCFCELFTNNKNVNSVSITIQSERCLTFTPTLILRRNWKACKYISICFRGLYNIFRHILEGSTTYLNRL